MAHAANDEDDPVVASFNVFINPTPPPNQKVLILHQSVRYDEGGTPAFPRVPSELRIKPHSGIVEVDVPLDILDNYDRQKGMQYGRALKDTLEAKGGGSHGLAGGFGIGAPTGGGGGGPGRKGRAGEERRVGEWAEEVRADRVLRSQTLGGIIPKNEPLTYMIGIFQGGDLHLTPATAFVNLNPQLHHVDALNQLDKYAPGAGAGPSKDPNAAGATPAAGGPSAAPRAIHMTIKNANDAAGDTVVTETMADRLRAVQAEPWRRMRYVDENEGEAWETFTQSFVPLREFKEPEEGAKEGAEEEDEGKSLDADLEKVPWLRSPWTASDLEARIARRPLGEVKAEGAGDGDGEVKAEDGEGRSSVARGKAPAAPARRTGRGAKNSSSTPMEID